MNLIRFLSQYIYQEPFYYKNSFPPKSIKHYVNIIQSGGTRKIKLLYNNEEFIFENIDDEQFILFSNKEEDCIAIIVDSKNKTANINNINGDTIGLCFKQITDKKGTLLLKLAIKFAKN